MPARKIFDSALAKTGKAKKSAIKGTDSSNSAQTWAF
jgi:hypothetical protein